MASVLEMTPSTRGWYYASPRGPDVSRTDPRLSWPPSRPGEGLVDAAVMAYGPDARIRLAPARPRIWLLA